MNSNRLPRKGNYLLVAATGGHLTQLKILSEVLELASESKWVTFRNAQSESLLSGREVTYVRYIAPRDWINALRAIPTFYRLLREGEVDGVISTGAAVAVPALLVASFLNVPAFFVESFSRVKGPSLSGRIIACIPRIRTFTQHQSWAGPRWRYELNILDAFSRHDLVATSGSSVRSEATASEERRSGESDDASGRMARIFVTLGTIRPYRFDRLVDSVLQLVEKKGYVVTWQLGQTTRMDLPGEVFGEVSSEQFQRFALESDVVITHAGVASCLQLVESGIYPIVVPRRRQWGEHVDDHQLQIAEELGSRGLCLAKDASELAAADVERVMRNRTR